MYKKKRNRETMAEVDESYDRQKIISDDSEEGYEYEVFLSFCGEDTRKDFTDHLYRYLMDLRIRTFRDNEGLHVGEEIGPELMEVIEKSKIMMPIFSKNYASSKWCLMELTHMVKWLETNKDATMMCPIFYDVTPSEVRNQTGSFQKAFSKHVKKFRKKTVDEWREALRKVPEDKGWERDTIGDWYDGKLVKEVGTKLLMELKKKHVEVTDHLVGMDQHEAELMSLLDLDCDDVKIVGIVGIGGIGKTTIAKFIYSKLCDDQFHQRCSFLENVREKAKQIGGLDDLKNKLMSEILKRTSDEVQLDQSTFKCIKALIVLDDVDDRSQLTRIIGKRDWYGHGSRIIVTTRNRDTFRKQEEEKIYEPPAMDYYNAIRLFCKHAFRKDCPLKGYEDLSKEIVSEVAGLPLSLEVIGSLLATKKKEAWHETLKKLRAMPQEIQKRLQISYDMLDHGQKEIFLDIACHFIESEKDEAREASYMWEDCGFFPVSGIDALVNLSLVKIDEHGRFKMHDQLRDLGREIVWIQNPDNPGDRSRLWSDEETLEALTNKMGTKRVQTLTLYNVLKSRLSNEAFERLSGLRYLDLSQTSNITGDFKGIFANLRWFRWHPTSQITEITNFCLPKLVVLDLSGSNISDGWEDIIQIKRATSLKVLDLSSCDNLTKTPDLSAFSKLERLNLGRCYNLAEISPSVGHLQHLNYLNLRFCGKCCEEALDNTSSESKLKLPEFIWNVKSLVELHMYRLKVTELSEAIGNLTHLSILDVGGTGIKKFPNTIGLLEKLEDLDASGCESLEELPETIGNLRSLRRLNIRNSGMKRLPSEIESLEKLEELDASGCESLEELPESIGNIRSLRRLLIADSGLKWLPSATGLLEKVDNEQRNRETMEEVDESNDLQQIISDDSEEGYEYEVFLSFCGEDTRKGFTDHLYRYLRDLRIQTFRGNEELQVRQKIGLTLMEAIEKSKIMMPIFSKNYASSEWCLMELTHMVKWVEMNQDTTMMCPIYYDVTPSQVKNQTGSFQEAFAQHLKKFDKETVNEWKGALGKVTEFKGWERDKIGDGHEGELVEKVGTKLLMELKKKHVEVTEHLVGMDQHEAELMSLLDLDCNDVKIVGIVGMGGIGKTTIAKFIYNKLCDVFSQRCSFLEDVREKGKLSGGLDTLKNKLMSDILKRTSDEVQLNQSTFKYIKALIVLDDVDDRSQLTRIIGKCDWFGAGSRIIVTTRNRDTFREKDGERIFEPGVLNSENVLRLFCKHAFRQDCPLEGYEDLSKEIVSEVAGLPLSLEVIGSLLATKKKEAWHETLEKLGEIMPGQIQRRLQIRHEGELVEEVGTELLMELKKKHVEVTEHLVGMDQHEAEVTPLLDLDCKDVRNVGIVGMGGIGKCTDSAARTASRVTSKLSDLGLSLEKPRLLITLTLCGFVYLVYLTTPKEQRKYQPYVVFTVFALSSVLLRIFNPCQMQNEGTLQKIKATRHKESMKNKEC